MLCMSYARHKPAVVYLVFYLRKIGQNMQFLTSILFYSNDGIHFWCASLSFKLPNPMHDMYCRDEIISEYSFFQRGDRSPKTNSDWWTGTTRLALRIVLELILVSAM